MSKYFIEKIPESKKISSFLSSDGTLNDYENKKNIVNYIISIVGDIELTVENLNIICKQFNRIAGRYNVMTEPETIKGMINFIKKYPFLSTKAIEALWPKFIYDLFEDYSLIDKFNDFLVEYGKNDNCYDNYINYIDDKAEKLQAEYSKDAQNLSEINMDFSQNFINYIKSLILNKHIRYKNIENVLPTPELVMNDEKTLLEISKRYRIYFGVCYPISYQMVFSLVKNNNLDIFDDLPKYYINVNKKTICCEAPFRKEEFMESINIYKEKKKLCKKEREMLLC